MVGHNILRPQSRKIRGDLVGSASEVYIVLEGQTVKALLDTGSTVSTLSLTFYNQYLKHLPLQSITNLIHIECADGQPLPYIGYIEASVEGKGVPTRREEESIYPILIVPDSNYNQTVPLLVGTNILHHILDDLKSQYGERFLQQANLFTPWYLAFRSLTLKEKELQRNGNRLAIVKSASATPIIIPPNTSVTLKGYVDKAIDYTTTPAILTETPGSIIPTDLEITPIVTTYQYPHMNLVDVTVDNVTTMTVQVPSKAIICEMQPVTIEETEQKTHQKKSSKSVLDLVPMDTENLTQEQQIIGHNLLKKYEDIFSTGETDIGHTSIATHHIELCDRLPFKQRPRTIPPSMFNEVKAHLGHLLEAGIIRKSRSPWSSNVVLCRKKNNELRMCVDFRQLNLRTKKDAYSLPRTEDILNALSGNKFFSILDMKSGYHQIEMYEPHKERTAFTVGPLGFYEFNRMPFGLVNAPATYQRLMEECFQGLHLEICYIYLDDIVIFSKTFEEHMERLEKVFQRFREVNLKLSPKKCDLFKKKVCYVGHIVSHEGIEPDPKKIEKVRQWPQPLNPDEVRKFLGFVGYYRRFIQNFSKISRPLSDLIVEPTKKARRKSKNSFKPDKWEWGKDQETAFNLLKDKLTSFPVLGYPDFSKPFELHTDASTKGLGAILYQEQDGIKRVIAYASRGLTKSERNYPVHKLEFLALKWSISEKFYDYLYGNTFNVFTDNNPLTYILSTAKLDATGQRWVASLASFNFSITYRSGHHNRDADALSRLPGIIEEREGNITIPKDSIQSICNPTITPYAECLTIISKDDSDDTYLSSMYLPEVNLKEMQWKDETLRYWIRCVRDQYKPFRRHLPPFNRQYHSLLHKNFEKLKIVNGLLVRERTRDNEERIDQVILPSNCIDTVLRYLHSEMGHPGRDKTLNLVRDRFFWNGMTVDVDNFIKNCKNCLLRKSQPERAPLVNIQTYQPLELVCIDYLTLEPSKGGIQNILVITDHFTKYAQAIPTRNQTARTTAEALFNNFILHYGIPSKLHSDQGAQFESNVIKELCNIMNIDKSRTTPYHPMGNGVCERFNRTLLKMLGTLETEQKSDWKSYIKPLVHAYNCMRQESTGFSPFFLMFGREPKLPVDIVFGLEKEKDNQNQPKTKYVESFQKKLKKSYDIVHTSTAKAKERQKSHYDNKTRGAVIQIGDRVLVKILSFDGKHKLANKWEEDPYKVLSKPNPDIPVYVVQKENGEGRKRTLHRNNLLPLNIDLKETSGPTAITKPKPTPRKRTSSSEIKQKETTKQSIEKLIEEDKDSDSDSEDMEIVEIREISNPPETIRTRESENEVDGNDAGDDQLAVSTTERVESEDAHDHAQSEETSDSTLTHTEVSEINAATSNHTDYREGEEDGLDDVDDERTQSRRSGRQRCKPKWMESGDFVLMQNALPDWKARADYLQDLVKTGFLTSVDSSVSSALIDIVLGKK